MKSNKTGLVRTPGHSFGRLANRRGLTLLELVIASALLTGVLFSTITYLRMGIAQQEAAKASAAVVQYESEIRDNAYFWLRSFLIFSMQSPAGTIHCPGGTVNFSHPRKFSETEFAQCLAGNSSGSFSAQLIGTVDSNIEVATPPASVASSGSLRFFQQCQRNLTVQGSASDYSNTSSFYFCLLILPGTAAGTMVAPDRESLLSMQPVIAEFTFSPFMMANDPSHSVQKSPGVATLKEYNNWLLAPGGPSRGPLLNYLSYRIHWRHVGADGSAYYKSYDGMKMQASDL